MVIILIVWALIVLSSYRFVFASSRETVIAGSYPEFLEKLFGVYIFWFNNYVGMFVSQVMGFGLFWAIGKRQKT